MLEALGLVSQGLKCRVQNERWSRDFQRTFRVPGLFEGVIATLTKWNEGYAANS